MTCPHCRASVLRKERTGSVCGHCGRPFALDPRLHGTGMNDLRIQRCVRQLTDDGRLQVTLTQLWYLTRTSNYTWESAEARGRRPRKLRVPAGALVVGLIVLAVVVQDHTFGMLLWYLIAGACVLLYVWAKGGTYVPAHGAGAYVSPPYEKFRRMMCDRWTEVYGGLPPGIVDDETFTRQPEPVAHPKAALLCPDRAVTVFLTANGLPRRLECALAGTVGALPDDVPLVVLHDASTDGALLASGAREARPERIVVDAGLPTRTVKDNQRAVRLVASPRASGPDEDIVNRLRKAGGLPQSEADWLAAGWWSPIAAVPPTLLESVVVQAVERAVERGRTATDPDRQLAASLGFLTWPEPSGSSPAGGRT